MPTKLKASLGLAGAGLALVLQAMSPAVAAAPPKPVKSIDDLPRYSYPYDGRAADLFTDTARLTPLVVKFRANGLATLAGYQIEDRATLRELHRSLLRAALLQGDAKGARREIAALGELQDKPSDRALSGLRETAYLDALSAGPAGSAAFKQAFRRNYAAALAPLDWSVVGDAVRETAFRTPLVSEAYLIGVADKQIQPAIDSGRQFPDEAVQVLLSLAAEYRLYLPLKAEIVEVVKEYISANAKTKADIWQARSAVIPAGASLAPVVVGIWDSGADVTVLRGKLFVNVAEKPDGKDNDGNGFIDDINGIGFDQNGAPVAELLVPIPDGFAPRLEQTREISQGANDLQAGIQSPEAEKVTALASKLTAEQAKQTFEDLDFYDGYAHGTHVSGIAAEGNPAVRLLIVRHDFALGSPPRRPTAAIATAIARSYRATVDYMKRAGVRVVNMSWGVDLKGQYEDLLAANGVPAGEREAEARRLFAIDSTGLREAIASAPEILFVCSAGNSNDSAAFTASVPAAIEAPNVLTVAAVDQAGDATGFTTGGPTVDIAASGFQVESVLPGGTRQRWSGTSMASPAVVNTAAKLLAVNPALTVAQLRDLLLKSATPTKSDFVLLDPAASLRKLTQR